jgi:hypothetical protein
MKFIKNILKNKIVTNVLGIFIISRLGILLISYLTNLIMAKGFWFGDPNKTFLDLFNMWDSGWYMKIVENGYFYTPGQESSVAFFPLYPMVVKFFSLLFGNPLVFGFIVSNVSLIIAGIYLYKLVELDFGDSTASKTVFFMMVSPVSFFFSIFFSEGLFLSLAIASFYYARKNQWLVASILGFFLALTRSIGVLIFIPLLIEYMGIDFKSFKLNLKKIKKDILYLLLIPLGLFSYMAYLFFKFGDAFAFSHASAAWGRKFVSIFTVLTNIDLIPHGTANDLSAQFYVILNWGPVFIALFLIGYLICSKIRFSYILYSFLLLFFYLSSNIISSMYRYISVLFPLYLGLALIGNKSRFWNDFLTLFSVMLLTFCTILFTNGYWFA